MTARDSLCKYISDTIECSLVSYIEYILWTPRSRYSICIYTVEGPLWYQIWCLTRFLCLLFFRLVFYSFLWGIHLNIYSKRDIQLVKHAHVHTTHDERKEKDNFFLFKKYWGKKNTDKLNWKLNGYKGLGSQNCQKGKAQTLKSIDSFAVGMATAATN